MLHWLIATLHLLSLPLGLGAVWARSRALRSAQGVIDLPGVFIADNLWGFAAFAWISTGLFRVFGGIEKGSAYYLHDRMFYIKMALLVIVLLLEIWPMATLIRWRIQVRRGALLNTAMAPMLARISAMQAGLVILMVFAATAVARGYFY
jgi:putative membrane protein